MMTSQTASHFASQIFMRPAIAFLFGVSVFVVACGQVQLSPLSQQAPTVITPPTMKISDTATPIFRMTPTLFDPSPAPDSDFLLTLPCESFDDGTPIPYLAEPTVETILDPKKAIQYADQLLICRGRVPNKYSDALAVPLEFADGERGMFLALGYGHFIGGYQLLFRVRDNAVKLVQFEYSTLSWITEQGVDMQPIDSNVPKLFKESRQLVKLTGFDHVGTALFDQYFVIIEIDETGAHAIFSAPDLKIAEYRGGYHFTYHYEYKDLDGDGIREVIQSGNDCYYAEGKDGDPLTTSHCDPVHSIYKYNGEQYVKQP